MTLLLALLIAASLASPAALAPSAAPSTSGLDPTTTPSPAASPESSIAVATTSPTTTVRRTPRPTATPEADDAEPTPDETPADDDASIQATTLPATRPTSAAPAAAVRAFRTPERAAPPAFVAPQIELPASGDETPPDQAATEPMPAPDEPYEATVTFRAVASAEVTGFGLMVIYPRSDGDFVGSGSGAACRALGDAALYADDNDQGMLRLRVTGAQPLASPLDVVCRFTVDPNAVLQARVIAVNVVDVVTTSGPGAPSSVAVSVLAH